MSLPSLDLLLIDCGSRKFRDLCAMTDQLGHRWKRLALEDAGDTLPQSPDAIVISGGPQLFTCPDPVPVTALRRSFAFLARPTPPVFGICLGFQALVLAAGGEIFLGPERRESDIILLTAPHPLTAGLDSGTSFREDHCEGILLPPGMQNLGHSLHYPVEIAADDACRRYGVQFHPEISGPPGALVLQNFFRLVQQGPSS